MLLDQMLDSLERVFEDNSEGIEGNNVISKLQADKSILIYGAGSGGRYSRFLLSQVGLPVSLFLDSNAEKIGNVDGIPVALATDSTIINKHRLNATVIISVGSFLTQREIAGKLAESGYTKTIGYIELFNDIFVKAGTGLASQAGFTYYRQREQQIKECFNLFTEEKSKIIYLSFIKGHAAKTKSCFAEMQSDEKYFPRDVVFRKGYSHYLDCGAYNGENLYRLERENVRPDILTVFEPDCVNFTALSELLKARSNNFANHVFSWPSAAWKKTEMTGFIQSGTVGSFISEASDTRVQGLALDDALAGHKPSFIKMDVEGGEYEALVGAEMLIRRHKPDLAICVYHAVNHIWDLPLLIHSWNLGYTFYLRAHNAYGMGTVLYAVCE